MMRVIRVGLIAMLAVLAAGCSNESDVWVGDVNITPQGDFSPGTLMSITSEDGKVRMTVFDADGHMVSALFDKGKSDAEFKTIEAELQEAAKNVRGALERVQSGWIAQGAYSTRATDRNGNGVQAARSQFSPEAKKVTSQ